MQDLRLDVVEKFAVRDRRAEQVDRKIRAVRTDRTHPRERIAHHPAIDRRHQIIALGGGYERTRRDEFIVFIDQAHEDLVMGAQIIGGTERRNRLVIQP